jgi:hypothetical protein
MRIPCTIYMRADNSGDYPWPYMPGDELVVIHLDEEVGLPPGRLRQYKGNDETGRDWTITTDPSDTLPPWIHTHPPAKTDPACTSCIRPGTIPATPRKKLFGFI